MSEAIPSLPQYVFMAWYSVKAQGQLYLYSAAAAGGGGEIHNTKDA
jgi:hypothetical protein